MTPYQEGERGRNQTNGELLLVKPTDLMRDNPAALIVNNESYQSMAAYFSPARFDPPQVVRVLVYSPLHGQDVKYFVVDGLTRTKYVQDQEEEIRANHPSFTFTVKDVTESLLQNRLIVPSEEHSDGERALTMLQYLRAVVPPTIEHSQIAPDRIAAHLINGWENMVGRDIANKFSALVALSLLQDPKVPMATREMLRRYIGGQERLMVQETIGERVRLQQALLEMADIIRQTRRFASEIAQAAFTLVCVGSPVIGGERVAQQQVYGLLHTPEVDTKFFNAFPQIGEREQMRVQVGQFLSDALRKFADMPNRQQAIDVFGQSLRDHSLGWNYVVDVLTSPNPAERYVEIRQELNKDKLRTAYVDRNKKEQLSEVESTLLDRLGRVTYLSDSEHPAIMRGVKEADVVMQSAERLQVSLKEREAQLVSTGVSSQTIQETRQTIEAIQSAVLSVSSLQALSRRVEGLKDARTEAERRITYQVSTFRASMIVDVESGGRFMGGYGPRERADVITYLVNQFGRIDESNEEAVRRNAKELTSLDPDILHSVLFDGVRIQTALQRQSARRAAEAVKPEEITVIVPPQPPAPIIEPPRSTEAQLPPSDKQPVPPQENVVVDRRDAEGRRVRLGNEKLAQAARGFRRVLGSVDLEPREVSEETKRELDAVLREAGKLRFKHPDIVRIVEDYQSELEKKIKLQEGRVEQEQEDITKATRTGR